jgi:hypothetical protein
VSAEPAVFGRRTVTPQPQLSRTWYPASFVKLGSDDAGLDWKTASLDVAGN